MTEDKRAGNHTVHSGLCEWLDCVSMDPTVDEDRDVDAALSQFGFQRRHAPQTRPAVVARHGSVLRYQTQSSFDCTGGADSRVDAKHQIGAAL